MKIAMILPLTTPRLELRAFADADFAAVHEYAADPEVVRHTDWGPNTPDETRAFLRSAAGGVLADPWAGLTLAVVLRAEGRVIGAAALHAGDDRDASLGYCLNRRYWGSGVATEAAAALLRLAFGPLGLHRVWATCRPENAASARVLEKVGMRREGHLRQNVLVRGVWRDSLLYAILEGDPRPENP